MMKRFAVLLISALAASAMFAASASAAVIPIRRHQVFQGLVNSEASSSVISVVGCATAVGTGHPLSGQTVSVDELLVPAPAGTAGTTGNAHAITADLEVSPNPMLPLIELFRLGTLKDYGTTLAISPSLTVPCHGPGTVVFTPVNGGKDASASAAQVTFESPSIVPSQSTGLLPGQVVDLQGSGFAPASTYTVKECGDLSWADGVNPCALSNPTTVRTDASGGFTTPFTIAACPLPSGIVITASCYLGVPYPTGGNTTSLAGAASITVTPFILPPAAVSGGTRQVRYPARVPAQRPCRAVPFGCQKRTPTPAGVSVER